MHFMEISPGNDSKSPDGIFKYSSLSITITQSNCNVSSLLQSCFWNDLEKPKPNDIHDDVKWLTLTRRSAWWMVQLNLQHSCKIRMFHKILSLGETIWGDKYLLNTRKASQTKLSLGLWELSFQILSFHNNYITNCLQIVFACDTKCQVFLEISPFRFPQILITWKCYLILIPTQQSVSSLAVLICVWSEQIIKS